MRRWGRFGYALNRAIHRSALAFSVLIVVIGGLAVAALTWWLLWRTLGARAETPNQLDLTRIALWVTVAVGAAVALTLAYRRQRDLERGRFAELFGAAAIQLGNPDVAVRIAGVYALAGVADGFSTRARRQQCVDVLCGYLRLPYVPDEGASHLVSKSQRVEDSGTAVERVYNYRQNDRQVRDTVVRVIAEHLRDSLEACWSTCDFDFSDAVLEDADFSRAVFAGRNTRFTNASFIGGRRTSFEKARFVGKRVSFRGATFRNSTSFDRAQFRHDRVARFERDDAEISFSDATFAGSVSFDGAEFSGARTDFTRATFAGDRSSFANAKFVSALTTFERAIFDGERVTFTGAEFIGARAAFTAARFYAEASAFDCARLGGKTRWGSGRTEEVTFARAEYHGKVSFADVLFGGRAVTFAGGDFFGNITFKRAAFDAREISFERPKAWVGVHFDWDGSPNSRPACIHPEQWPPVPAESPPELTR
ncbi:pentapeptide repeat-containing protein [Nocardia jejuensis]|uniref:pentapeptide repeat-containing protein n=1 Tax=Nocardia jejuensis TaxID=328049 RepID=UPI000834C6B6|nr:pentapeptide repeat-containing protein [Nocardia jejuensis]